MKKLSVSILAVIFILSTMGVVFAGDKGNARKGKYTYRKVYEACHKRGAAESAKPAISPDEKTQAQWTRLFDKKDYEDFGCMEEWEKLSDGDILNIYTYLHKHAADSPTPAKCK